jgi:hypothetical protein
MSAPKKTRDVVRSNFRITWNGLAANAKRRATARFILIPITFSG